MNSEQHRGAFGCVATLAPTPGAGKIGVEVGNPASRIGRNFGLEVALGSLGKPVPSIARL
jgi:hypothetical protein